MKQHPEDIYSLIAKSFSGQLAESELYDLEQWKSAREENKQEYNDLLSIWIRSGELKMPTTPDQEKAKRNIDKVINSYLVKRNLSTWLTQAAAVLVLSLVFSAIYSYYRYDAGTRVVENNVRPIIQETKAAFGTQTKIELADGTRVYLNSGSKLLFPQTFNNQDERIVELDGEGYFEVAKNEQQPFIVNTEQVSIKVLGTKFDVDAYSGDNSVSVALVEGSIELKNKSAAPGEDVIRLYPNQVATLDVGKHMMAPQQMPDLYKYTAWVQGRIVFFGDPIQVVVKKLSKWYNADIIISDKKLENYQFTGTFINEPLDQILNFLSKTSQMTYVVEPAVKQKDNIISKSKIMLKSKI